MQILIIAPVIWPFQSPRSFRATELAKELAKNHQVTLLSNTLGSDYSDFERDFNIKIKPFKKLQFIRKHSSKNLKQSILNRILIKLFKRSLMFPNIEFFFNISKSLKSEANYDLLISIGAPHSIHWGCVRALKNNPSLAKVWIADCGDPFMGNKFLNPPKYFSFLEKKFMRRADFITVPIEEAKDAYYPEFRHKIKVIPQGFNFEGIKIHNEKIKNKVPTFAFAGMVYKDLRDPSKFMDFLLSLNEEFKFIVYTKDVSLFPKYKALLGQKFEMRSYIPREELIYELSKMDFLINFENTTTVQSPSKLIDYALTKRPILSVGSKIIEEERILDFLKSNNKDNDVIDIEQFNIKNIACKFVALAQN